MVALYPRGGNIVRNLKYQAAGNGWVFQLDCGAIRGVLLRRLDQESFVPGRMALAPRDRLSSARDLLMSAAAVYSYFLSHLLFTVLSSLSNRDILVRLFNLM